jgi:hypothetical protein
MMRIEARHDDFADLAGRHGLPRSGADDLDDEILVDD